jgi:LPS O-antigen subunit length determinant protein (WzzB/FepE family)
MADPSFKGRREESIHQLRAEAEPEKVFYPYQGNQDHVIDLGPYVDAIWASWRIIAVAALAAMVLTALTTSLLLRKSYRAIAILRPIPKAATASRIAGMFGVGGAAISPLASLMGGAGGPGADEAQEYMTILQSFAFNTALIDRHHLDPKLFHPTPFPFLSLFEYNDPRWRAYKRMQKWFSCEYSIKTGNVTLYFKGRSPSDAETILGYYVDDLREKLRYREVQSAKAAIDSMKTEARVTSDALLQSQLYELIAKQTQQLKLAQVEADFAFNVLEPPAAPDKPYSPFVILDSTLAGLLALVASSAFVVVRRIAYRDKAT